MTPEQPSDDVMPTDRRQALRLAALAFALPLLAACKSGSQAGSSPGGSGLDTIRQVRERNPHYGR